MCINDLLFLSLSSLVAFVTNDGSTSRGPVKIVFVSINPTKSYGDGCLTLVSVLSSKETSPLLRKEDRDLLL